MADGPSNTETKTRVTRKGVLAVVGAGLVAVGSIFGLSREVDTISSNSRQNIDNPDAYPPGQVPPRLQTITPPTESEKIREAINPGYQASKSKP